MLNILLFFAGLAALVAGATLLVRGASALALRLGISPLVVGLTVVAFGTSAPEMSVTTLAVLAGSTDMAVGNVVGSNIFNILFILGVAALITPLEVHRQVIRQEAPIMVGGAILLVAMCQDGRIDLLDGTLLMALMLAYTTFVVWQSRKLNARMQATASKDAPAEVAPTGWDAKLPMQLLLIVAGLGLLVAGSDAMVSAATVFARAMGIPEAVIGLTILAAGTSLPEVAASITASLKGERDIAIGNVVGSCIFNTFGVVGLGGLVASLGGYTALMVPQEIMRVDIWVMLATAVACLPIFFTDRSIARWEAALFLGYYFAYTAYLVMVAQRYSGTDAFAGVIVQVVAPLTVATLVFSLVRRLR